MTITEIGCDDWGRRLFKTWAGQLLVDVDGVLFTITPDWGEPCSPVGVSTPVKKEIDKTE